MGNINDWGAFHDLTAEHEVARPVKLRSGEIADVVTALLIAENAIRAANGDRDAADYLKERLTFDPEGHMKGEQANFRALSEKLEAADEPHRKRRLDLMRRIAGQ